MNDRVYPSSKPQPLNGSTASAFPATKAQLYGATRPAYRPQPPPRRSRRSCCCRFCCWLTLIIVTIILLLAIAGAVAWVLYRPHHPDFSVAALQISTFNLTSPKSSSPRINALINLSLLAKNPNKKLVFLYDPMSVTVFSNGVEIAQGSFPGFLHGKKNTTTIKAALTSSGAKAIDSTSAGLLSSDLKKNGGKLPIEIKMETKVRVKIGGMKTEKVGIRVSCDGIQASVPKGKEKPSASDSVAKCKVKLRIKIWKWKI